MPNTFEDISSQWQPGGIIADLYQVKELIGWGGMGTVHRVHHLNWKVDLAVKTPNEQVLQAAGGRERFQEREAYEWVRLGLHPNIASCFYVRTLDDGFPRVFTEYVENGSLADWLKQTGALDLKAALDIGIQICWGLGWAHKRGLVHRDIKPANILMTKGGSPKLTDFGLVKLVGEVKTESTEKVQSNATTAGGTEGYAAPEQRQSSTVITTAADVFSVGVVLYELLQHSLALPIFPGAVPRARVAQYQIELKKREDTLAQILLRCLAYQPQDRYSDVMTLAEELQAVYATIVGHPYLREMPIEGLIVAAGKNNQALSLLDLSQGARTMEIKEARQREAESCWKEALQADPYHLETTYNQGITHWRRGYLTDDELVRRLETVRANRGDLWQIKYLLALVHLERGDLESAEVLLQEELKQVPEERAKDKEDVRTAFNLARSQITADGSCLYTFRHSDFVASVYLSQDKKLALSASGTRLQAWDLSSLNETGLGREHLFQMFSGHTDRVTSVHLSVDNRLALSGSGDNMLRLWEVNTGRCVRTFNGHTDAVTSVCLSNDGLWALSGSLDKSVRLWEVETGNCLKIFSGHSSAVGSVAFTTDGLYAVSGGGILLHG